MVCSCKRDLLQYIMLSRKEPAARSTSEVDLNFSIVPSAVAMDHHRNPNHSSNQTSTAIGVGLRNVAGDIPHTPFATVRGHLDLVFNVHSWNKDKDETLPSMILFEKYRDTVFSCAEGSHFQTARKVEIRSCETRGRTKTHDSG